MSKNLFLERKALPKEIKQRMTVFITDGAERTSLAIARSLGKKGIEVHVGESYDYKRRR